MKHKIAKNKDEAWKIQEFHRGKPHGWIQWQGTFVCLSLKCKCGKQTHIDDEFVFNVKCCHCGTVYFCNGHIELIELEEEPENGTKETFDPDDPFGFEK